MASPVVPDDLKVLIPSPTSNLCEGFAKSLIGFPTKVWQLVKYMFNSDGTLTDAFKVAANYISPGFITQFAGATVPSGWLECHGQTVSRTTYAALFAVIGTQFGAGDNVTTFGLPDMRDRFPIGSGNAYSFGVPGGAATVSLTLAQMPPHTHTYNVFPDDIAGTGQQAAKQEMADTAGTGALVATTNSSGGTGGTVEPHTNVPPYLPLKFLIKT